MLEAEQRGVVLVTGAGRGIGAATALLLARAGYPLVLVSRREAALREVHEQCAALVPTRSRAVDVRDAREVERLGELLEGLPPLAAVVNNAGVGAWSPVEQLSLDSWDEQIETNLRAPFLIIQQALPHFRRQGRGLIINVASDCALVGMSERAAYNASKYGLVGLTTSLRAELNCDGIHCCLIYAGKVDTHFRGHSPGDRPGALKAEQVGRAILFVVEQFPSLWIGEISLLPPGAGIEGQRSLI